MANESQSIEKINALVGRLQSCSFDGVFEQAMGGFVFGAAYSIRMAISLGWRDGLAAMHTTSFQQELVALSKDFGAGKTPSQKRWLAGYYYNSAILRVAALRDALHKAQRNPKQKLNTAIQTDVNNLKHNIDDVITKGMASRIEDVIAAIAIVVEFIETLDREALQPITRDL